MMKTKNLIDLVQAGFCSIILLEKVRDLVLTVASLRKIILDGGGGTLLRN